jgi:hypothetical protein
MGMDDFIDLKGASGADYRFRRSTNEQSSIAGNFAVIRESADGYQVLTIGHVESLSGVPAQAASGADAKLYVRYNVAYASRCADHTDIIARYGAAVDATATSAG